MSLYRCVARSIVAGVLLLSAPAVMAQDLTGKTIRFIVPYTAGGAGDVLARVLGQSISESSGLTIVVEDKPGASSMIGSEYASRQTPDGTTILLVENPFILSAVLHPVGHYHPVNSFDPICYLADTPAVLAVSSTSEIKTLADFVKAAKDKPGTMSYGSTGPASTVHIAAELWKRAAGIDLAYAPFPGSPPAMQAVMGGHINAVIANYSDLKSQLSAGGLRPLAVPAAKRSEALPDVPTLEELGYKNIEGAVWFGFVAPAGTPKDILAQFVSYFTAAIKLPDVKAKLAAQGLFVSVSCGDAFGKFIAAENDKYTTLTREFDIKGE
ncbi:MAG TPA: tripartite tricarboxylate transporter substrate binding protein [Pseudolabrys sp.]